MLVPVWYRYQAATRSYFEKLAQRQTAKQVQDSSKLKHVSLVMSATQVARLGGGTNAVAGGDLSLRKGTIGSSDNNILQGTGSCARAFFAGVYVCVAV